MDETKLREAVERGIWKAWEQGLIHGAQPTDEDESTLPRAAEVIADVVLAELADLLRGDRG